MLNAYPLNAQPLNAGGAGQGDDPGPNPPVPVAPALSFTWRLVLMIGGVDYSAQLTGSVSVDREEGAAGLATVIIFLPPGPVVPTDWIGRPVTLDYVSEQGGVVTQSRRYTGQVSDPSYDATQRLLTLNCSDQLQKRVEAMAITDIDALVGGYWSGDVFEPTEGRSRWDYAGERLGTIPSSLDASAAGALRVTSWFAQAPAFEFGTGTTVYQSIRVELAQLDRLTNVVEIEGGYRYARLWQQNNGYNWAHPETGGLGGLQGFCQWRRESSELPTVEMIKSEVSSSGQTIIGGSYYTLPLSMANPCADGIPWINVTEGLVLTAAFTGARRWTQQVTESLTLKVYAPASVAQAGEQVSRERLTVQIEDEKADDWESDEFTGGIDGFTDLGNSARRAAAIEVLLHQAQTTILSSHRDTTVSWDFPASMCLGADLDQTLSLADQGVKAVGKCRQLEEAYDLEAGSALITATIAVMRGGGSDSDGLTAPTETTSSPKSGSTGYALNTQLGGHFSSGEYDEDRDGFAGMYSNVQDSTLETFPRRMKIPAPEIPATLRDEQKYETKVDYRVVIPNDTLEL
ncbi:MAG TPA: hypothetical protein DGS68_06670 [Pseudomonas sp.]|nr:hypothetical protein [Pseudomonas sp.]